MTGVRCSDATWLPFLFQIFVQNRSGSTLGSTFGSTFLQNLGLHFNEKRPSPRGETYTLDRVFAPKYIVKGVENYIFYLRRGKMLKRLNFVQ